MEREFPGKEGRFASPAGQCGGPAGTAPVFWTGSGRSGLGPDEVSKVSANHQVRALSCFAAEADVTQCEPRPARTLPMGRCPKLGQAERGASSCPIIRAGPPILTRPKPRIERLIACPEPEQTRAASRPG